MSYLLMPLHLNDKLLQTLITSHSQIQASSFTHSTTKIPRYSMAILASLPGINLFSSLPSTPPNDHQNSPSAPPKPPIPVPKYPPPLRSQRRKEETVTPAFKTPHYRTKYYRPVKEGAVLPPAGAGAGADDRAVVIGKSGVSFRLPGAPFEFQYSYSETPKAKPVAIREPAFLPFAPPSMPRPWTGKAPLKSAKEKKMRRKTPLFDIPAEEDGEEEEGGVRMQMPRPFPYGRYPRPGRTREDVLGEPLKKWEIKMMVNPMIKDNRQVNLGRDGLTHNMLELVHSHWKRTEICKVRCKGVPTVDMLNVCRHLEEKTGGKIIYRAGGVVYLYRGRNYNYATRPQYPIMLWKPAAPVYPKLIQEAPGGLTKREADELRSKGKKLLPISKLAKNGVYITLVKDVRNAFEASPLAKIDCTGLHASDYKKIGAKLMELVPCVLLSFDDEQILMWRGSEWKSLYALPSIPMDDIPSDSYSSGKGVCDDENRRIRSSPKMVSLWKRAIESNKAMLLEKINLAPDDLLKKVEEFEGVSQANEHSYPALLVPAEEGSCSDFDEEAQLYRRSPSDSDDGDFADDYDEHNDDDLYFDSDTSRPLGSLPIDVIAKKYYRN